MVGAELADEPSLDVSVVVNGLGGCLDRPGLAARARWEPQRQFQVRELLDRERTRLLDEPSQLGCRGIWRYTEERFEPIGEVWLRKLHLCDEGTHCEHG